MGYNHVDQGFITEHKLGFVFKMSPLTFTELSYWFAVPKFLDEIELKMKRGEHIDNRVIYNIMVKVYERQLELRKVSDKKPDFNYKGARTTIKRLKRFLDETPCDQQGFSNK